MRVFVVALLVSTAAHAEDRVPEALGLMVMLKVLSYDTAFPAHGTGDFVVLVPFSRAQEAKANALVQVGNSLEARSIKERPLHFVAVSVDELGAKKGTALLLAFGISADTLKPALEKARAEKIYVMAFDEASVREGALLGVGLANGKPQPLINVAAMREIGADFGPVLRLARTFQ